MVACSIKRCQKTWEADQHKTTAVLHKANTMEDHDQPSITADRLRYEMQTQMQMAVPSAYYGLPSNLLYVSHFLSTWNTRGFEFGAILFLASIYPGTLLPMSIYALVRAAAAIIFSHYIGQYIDSSGRLPVVRLSIVGQRIAVVLSCVGFLFLLLRSKGTSTAFEMFVFAVLVLLASIEKLCSIMNTIAVERDWVVVIAGSDEKVLQKMNSQMRRIDLFCKLVAPLAVALLDGFSTRVALLTTLGLNLTSVSVEYPFIAVVYHKVPALWTRTSGSIVDVEDEEVSSLDQSSDIECSRTKRDNFFGTLKVYVSSTAFLPSLTLSMLYLTVLSFSGQMTTFLLAVPSPKMTSTTIGLLRTVSTVFEISATWAAPYIMKAIGPVRAGIWCLSWQLICLTSGVGVLWSPASDESASTIILFVSAVVLSRTGLWSFDLVAQLLIQNSIDSSHRGSFSSAEAALQNFFELCTFAMTIVFSKPEQFKWPALVSLVATYCAAALYAKFVRDRRGHLLHLPSCLKHASDSGYEMANVSDDQE